MQKGCCLLTFYLQKMFILNSATYYLCYCFIGCILSFYVLFIYKNIKLLKFSFSNNGFFVPILPFVGTVYLSLFTGDTRRDSAILRIISMITIVLTIVVMVVTSRIPLSVLESTRPKTIINVLSTAIWLKNKFGYPCNSWMGMHYIMFNTDPAENKIILNHPKCIDKPIPFYDNFKVLSKNSLFQLPYNKWKPRRKHFLKSYRPKVLRTYQQTFYKQSCELLKELKNQKTQENMFDTFNRYSFLNFFLTSVGLEEEKIDYKQMFEFGHLLDEIQKLAAFQIIDPVTPIELWLRFFPKGQKTAKLVKGCKVIVSNVVQQKKEQHANFQEFTENANELPLLDSMLYVNGKQMSDGEIFEEMVLFSAAATETTGNVMAFCFICLAMNPDIQETLYNEIMTVIGHNTISSDDLQSLKYTEAVIMETLRLFPALPLIGRYVNEDINVGSRIIPKGTNYIISIFHLHRDPSYWPDPLNFDPTRFLPGNIEQIQPYTYLAFSGGPRDCIGKIQAMILMKTTIANVVRNFRISSNVKSIEDIRLSSCLSMKAIDPLYCNFTSRCDMH